MTNGWKSVVFGDVVELRQGLAFNRKNNHLMVDEGIPLLRITDLIHGTTTKFVDSEKVDPKFISRSDDIIYTRTGQVGLVFKGRYGIVHNNCFRVIPSKGIDRSYLYWFLRHPTVVKKAKTLASGAAQPDLNHDAFKSIPFCYPDLPTQRKIAGILSAYDDLIENNLRRIRILEEMAQSLYREWFVHFRFPGHESTSIVDSPLGPIPEGWEVKKLGQLYKTSSGGTPSRKKTEYYEGGTIEWVKTGELRDSFVLSSEERITPEALKSSSAKLFPSDTVLIALYGATIGQLGILSHEASTNQACCALLAVNPPFGRAFAFLTLLSYRDEIIGLRLGAAQQNISQAILREFEVICPPVQFVEDFNQQSERMLDLLHSLQRRNQFLRQTRDLLLPKLLNQNVKPDE